MMQPRLAKAKESYEDLKKALEPSFFEKLGIKHPIVEFRTPFDRSNYSSLENILRGFFKSFITAYGAKAALNLVTTLIKFNQVLKKPSLLIKALISKDNFMLGWFMAMLTGVMKATILLCRLIRKKDDGYNGAWAGFVAGYLSFFFWKRKSGGFLACFMLSRAFDCYYNHLINSGKIKKRSWHYPLLFSFLNILTGYGYAHEKYLIDPALNKFYEKVTAKTPNDSAIMNLWLEITRRRLVRAGVIQEPYLLDI
jgi:hypothetical protein